MLSNYEKMESSSQQEQCSEPEGKDRRPLLVPGGSLLICDHKNSCLPFIDLCCCRSEPDGGRKGLIIKLREIAPGDLGTVIWV